MKNKPDRRNFLQMSAIITRLKQSSLSPMDVTEKCSKEWVEKHSESMAALPTKKSHFICLPKEFATSDIPHNYSVEEKNYYHFKPLDGCQKISEQITTYLGYKNQ